MTLSPLSKASHFYGRYNVIHGIMFMEGENLTSSGLSHPRPDLPTPHMTAPGPFCFYLIDGRSGLT